MRDLITIRMDKELGRLLDETARRLRRTRSEIVREALRRQLGLYRFERLRARTAPFAEARGLLTDEDVFRVVS